jgi:hypothetical protein
MNEFFSVTKQMLNGAHLSCYISSLRDEDYSSLFISHSPTVDFSDLIPTSREEMLILLPSLAYLEIPLGHSKFMLDSASEKFKPM